MENLGIDPKLLIAQLINFGLFFYIFKKFISKPFQLYLKNDVKKEGDKNRLLGEAEAKEKELEKRQAELERKAKKQQLEIMESAKTEAKKIKEELLIEAKKEIQLMRDEAKKAIESEKNKNKADVERQIVEVTSVIVKNLLKSYLNEDASRQLTASMLKNLSEELSKYES